MTRVWTGFVRPDWEITFSGTSDADAANGDRWMSASDDDLVEACLAGRHEVFAAIVERHKRRIYQLCYRFAGNHADASDLTQDVFIRTYRALRKFKRQSTFGTWLYRIAVNVCLNHVSASRPHVEPLDGRHPEDAREPPDVALMRDERAAHVRAAIARLPQKQRATLILRVYHELPHADVAAILGTSVGAAKANFFHALAKLEKLLRESAVAKQP